MYKLNIEELGLDGEPEIVKTVYFEKQKEMFDFAFDVKRDNNKIFVDDSFEILNDWKRGEPKIKSFDYRNFVLTSSVCIDGMSLIEQSALFLHGESQLIVSNGRQLLRTMENIKKRILLLKQSIKEYEKNGVKTNE